MSKPRHSELYKFHRSRLRVRDTPHPLKRESELGVKNLLSFRTKHTVPPYPRANCAAVLVALFVGRAGDLYVLLSRQTLRSYAGDTALPGGRVDDEDETIEDTARREAFEEIGLPNDKTKLPLLCVLDPFLAGSQVLVTPVVVLILDNTVQPVLNAPEVETLFSHPLASFLSSTFPERAAPRGPFLEAEAHAETAALELRYHTYSDVPWPWPWHSHNPSTPREASHRAVRMHRFLTGREAGGIKPIFGLTAAILIRTAAVAYGHPPDFPVQARNEPELSERVAWSLRHPAKRLEEAMHEESFEAERAAQMWEKWEGERWKSGWFRQRARFRL
ncbi:NUDIX hydrolase domain-like protein [Lactarius akahatsu]|uniref:NUDIX hydrolase domain-like protein n=1 Tax=Lactarius akahatsu TaxID=416441 RepID=A0AAD4LT52_9AGAM|nr:NUDIX hydrolase domain-like protein [Lactarius akahatsu]